MSWTPEQADQLAGGVAGRVAAAREERDAEAELLRTRLRQCEEALHEMVGDYPADQSFYPKTVGYVRQYGLAIDVRQSVGGGE